MKDLINGIKNLLAPNGIFVFEVSYLVDVIQKNLFDTIYHEHVSYHSVIPLIKFFNDNEMELIEAIRVDSHGGSLRGIVQMKGGSRKIGDSVKHCIALEKEIGIDQFETYVKFFHKINKEKNELQKLLQKLKNDKKSIVGFGAPAKATTFLYHFAIKPEVIDYIIDDSPLEQGLFTPGMHIPVYSSEKLYEKNRPLTVVRPGTQTRRFTHIKDTIDTCFYAWRKNQCRHYSISNKKSYTIIQVAKMFNASQQQFSSAFNSALYHVNC
jgi:hypothetical protein